ncbi:hypothetical protein [Paenibacillus pini]|uniref:Esterase n=1 Tax=Paenibacillus pini JCM 16418 TaxID=1236976 RepID=W7YW86_9BACL|nr:hypothetical protein [Paenibacillus pini]GAF08911.1 hypothetical protein JCM16418_3021 [Paenibacillus pini JCM 16418]
MDNKEVEVEVIDSEEAKFEALKKSIHRNANWRERLEAIQQLDDEVNDQQIIDILTARMNNDSVYEVQEAAYNKLKSLGEDVQMPEKKKGELVKGLTKILIRIKKSLPAGHSYEEFKEKFKKMRIDIYDVYEGEKGAEFDSWLESTWASLPSK